MYEKSVHTRNRENMMTINLQSAKEKMNSTRKAWRRAVSPYQNPDTKRSIWQLINSLGPYLLLWGMMVWSLRVSYWLTLLLAIPTAGWQKTFAE